MLNKPLKGHVAILMGTYNGAPYIEKQLNSIKHQKWKNWSLWVSDDGSSDDTRSIIESSFSKNQNDCTLLQGPEQGFCENFKSMIGNENIISDYYAFADQDDIWLPDKLSLAVSYLSSFSKETPVIYCSRTQLIDKDDNVIGYSSLNHKNPGFSNALIQNIASGNTMVFNHAARQLFHKTLSFPMIAHDWALYLIVTACGGSVFYDPLPTVLYRQHTANLIGNGMKLSTRFGNLFDAYRGRNRRWNDLHFQILDFLYLHMTFENRARYNAFRQIRNSNIFSRLKLYKASKVYHQNRVGQITNFSYVLFNKF